MPIKLKMLLVVSFTMCLLSACEKAPVIPPEMESRIEAINERYVFADLHAHPSRFHRANVEAISEREIGLYRSNHIDLVVANISSDMAFSGGYENRDGTEVERGEYKPAPGDAYSLAADRLMRLQKTIELERAVHANTPTEVLVARNRNEVAIMPALEGADALEGDIGNLHEMHGNGLRLIQLVHFRNNELGHMQTYPYSPGGLTAFGRKVVQESNRLGIVIDLAHANNETIMDVLALSTHPVIFSHGGARALHETDRSVSDDEIRAISSKGGVIGIWPNGSHVPTVQDMVDHIEYVIEVAGIDHVGIGSDLRGMSRYSAGFGDTANFRAIAVELIERGHNDEAIGKIMGGNFFRVWQTVAESG